MSKRRDLEHENIRFKVLRMLEGDPSLSQRQIAERLGISLGAVNYCLRALVEKGLIKLSRFREAEDKRRYAYLLTPAGIAEKARLTQGFIARKMQEYAAIRAEIEALRQELERSSPARRDRG